MDVAIERARVVYQREKTHAAPASAVVRHWNLTPGSSSANLSVATLKSFGLLIDEGSGEGRLLRLSDLAIDILLHPEQAKVQEAIRTAALTPRLHRELYEKYGNDLPSDASLKYQLIRERGFTESGAQDFMGQFRKTVSFALSDLPDSVSEDQVEPPQASLGKEANPVVLSPSPSAAAAPTHQPSVNVSHASGMSIPIPLTGGTPVVITGQFPISEAAWQQLLRVLEAMKPGLVTEPSHHGPDEA